MVRKRRVWAECPEPTERQRKRIRLTPAVRTFFPGVSAKVMVEVEEFTAPGDPDYRRYVRTVLCLEDPEGEEEIVRSGRGSPGFRGKVRRKASRVVVWRRLARGSN